MLTVALTGGIACGKSYSLKEFEKLGVFPIDADRIAHEAIARGTPAYDQIVSTFGNSILDSDGQVDRKALGRIIFSDTEARLKLNDIVHPFVFEREAQIRKSIQDELSTVSPLISMTDAALMVETGWHKNYDVVIVVYCHPEIQLRRLVQRDRITKDEAQSRIESQMPLLDKVRYADYIIENSGKLQATQEQIHHIFADLKTRFL